MILNETYTLSNGVKIPKVGLGTWLVNNEDVKKAVNDGINTGYRHIDTAQAYENETGVGEGIRKSHLKREDVFVTSKLLAEIKSHKEAKQAIDESLRKIGLDYIDLMLIHSPKPWKEFHGDNHYFDGNREAWKALEEAYEAGKIRAIGVSNFEKEDIDNLLDAGMTKPMVNQVLSHVRKTPEQLINYCKEKDILVEAYSPLGHGKLLRDEEVAKLAEKYNVSVPQIGIRYCLQLGLLPLPKAANPAHMKNNSEVDFDLSQEDMEHLRSLK